MTEQILSGSCLCGALKYRLKGTPDRFYHCHCSRCRKSSGTGHATNMFVHATDLEWTGDTGLIRSFKLPEAQRFTRTFCAQCGGPLPRLIKEIGVVFIPAGTLDVEPDMRPQARIFCDSRTNWSCDGDDLPRFANYPS